MSSLGYVMMNWSYEWVRQSRGNKRKHKHKNDDVTLKTVSSVECHCAEVQTDATSDGVVMASSSCDHVDLLEQLTADVALLSEDRTHLRDKLDANRTALADAIDKASKLRSAHDDLQLNEAQLRYELEVLQRSSGEKEASLLEEHLLQINQLEKLMTERDRDWSSRLEIVQRELATERKRSIDDCNRGTISIHGLEQELSSLRSVLEMRSSEVQDLRRLNAELTGRVERQRWLEAEVAKARQRLEEMNIVVQNKMVAEKEMLDLTEALTNELGRARNDILHLRRELENRQYLHARRLSAQAANGGLPSHNNGHMNGYDSSNHVVPSHVVLLGNNNKDGFVSTAESSPDLEKKLYRNQHQKASCGNRASPSLVVDVVEKSASVAWMLHMPDSQKLKI